MNIIEKKEPQNKLFTIPNILSAFRILLIPVFFYLYLVEKHYLAAIIIIVISGFTDVIDGYIARKFNQISKVGKVLDPTADKLTQAAIAIALSFKYNYIIIVFIVLAVKEAIMLVLGIILYKHTKLINGSNWHGKLAAVVVYGTLLMHLIWSATNKPIAEAVSYASLIITIGFMIFTLIMYSIDYYKLIKEYNILNEKAISTTENIDI